MLPTYWLPAPLIQYYYWTCTHYKCMYNNNNLFMTLSPDNLGTPAPEQSAIVDFHVAPRMYCSPSHPTPILSSSPLNPEWLIVLVPAYPRLRNIWNPTSFNCLSPACRACDYVYIDYVRRSRSSSCRLLCPINCQTYITLQMACLQTSCR